MSTLGSMEEVRKVFNKFDKNGDGKISVDELKDILRALGTKPSAEEVKRIMQEIDKDGDGYIDLDSVTGGGSAVDGSSKELKDAFDLFNVDKDDLISVSERDSVLKKLELFSQVDSDGDGNVNFEEFKKTMTRSMAKSFHHIIVVLVALLQVSCKESPFKTHPIQIWVFVVATIIYGLTFQLSNVVAVISGSLSTVSLVSIFLPRLLGFLIFIPWSFVPIVVAYQPIRSIFKDIHDACLRLDRQMIMDFISRFFVDWTWLTRSSSFEQEQEHDQP